MLRLLSPFHALANELFLLELSCSQKFIVTNLSFALFSGPPKMRKLTFVFFDYLRLLVVIYSN